MIRLASSGILGVKVQGKPRDSLEERFSSRLPFVCKFGANRFHNRERELVAMEFPMPQHGPERAVNIWPLEG